MPLGHPDAADVHAVRPQLTGTGDAEHEFGRPAADVGHEQRRAQTRQPRHRTDERQGGLLVAGDHLGLDAQHGVHHRGEVVAVGGIAGGAGGHHADGRRAVPPDQVGEVDECVPGAFDCLGGQPAGAVDALTEPDDAHVANDVDERAVGGRVGDQQADRVRPAVDRSDAVAARSSRERSSSVMRHAWAGRPPRLEPIERLVAERIDPTPGGQRVPDQYVQALHPVGHAARADAVDLLDVPDLLAAGEVRLVRGPVASGQIGVAAQPVGHLAHQAGRFERADRRGGARAGQVVQRGERRAVGQPRRGFDDVGVAARAAVRNGPDRPGRPAQLRSDGGPDRPY